MHTTFQNGNISTFHDVFTNQPNNNNKKENIYQDTFLHILVSISYKQITGKQKFQL